MSIITYGAHTLDISKLPQLSVDALIRRGVSHFLGNEQASKVVAKAEAWQKANTPAGGQVPDVPDDLKSQWKHEAQLAAVEALHAGTIGTSVRGPKADPLEDTMYKLAKKKVLEILAANGIKAPKKDEAVTFSNGVKKSLEDMIQTRLTNFGDELKKEAEKVLADAAREAKRTQDKLAKMRIEGANTADNLGL